MFRNPIKKFYLILLIFFCATFLLPGNAQVVEGAEKYPVERGKSYVQSGKRLIYKTGKIDLSHKSYAKLIKLVVRDVGKKKETVLSTDIGTNDFFVRGNYVYYSTKNGIYRIRLDGKKQLLYKAQKGYGRQADIIDFSGNYLYYLYKSAGETY